MATKKKTTRSKVKVNDEPIPVLVKCQIPKGLEGLKFRWSLVTYALAVLWYSLSGHALVLIDNKK